MTTEIKILQIMELGTEEEAGKNIMLTYLCNVQGCHTSVETKFPDISLTIP